MELIWPDSTTETIDAIRGVVGRAVVFYSEHQVVCSACSINPITDTSTDAFCPVCSGVGYVITFSGTTISGHVTHNPSETINWTTGGKLPEGDCRVQIKYTPDNLSVVQNASYVIVDDNKYDVRPIIKRGVPTVNRLLIDLMRRP